VDGYGDVDRFSSCLLLDNERLGNVQVLPSQKRSWSVGSLHSRLKYFSLIGVAGGKMPPLRSVGVIVLMLIF
jgi:hypothetical protein